VAKAVCELADHCVESDPQKALGYYEYAMDNWPGTADTMWAQSGLVKVNLALGNANLAEAAYEALLSQFPEHENLPEAVYEVASTYQELDPARGLEIHEDAMNRWPGYNWDYENDAIIPQKNLIVLRILAGDESGAQSAYETLLAEFSNHENIPEAIYEIAEIYGERDPQKAQELYGYAMNRWPDYNNWMNSGDAISQQMNLVLMKIELGDKEGADAICEKIINNFSQDDNVTKMVNSIADAYLSSGGHDKAHELYQYAMQQGAESGRGIWADVALFKSDILLGNDLDEKEQGDLLMDYSEDPESVMAVFTVVRQYYNQAFVEENKGDNIKAEEYFQNAISVWNRVLKQLPKFTTLPLAAESHHLIGISYYRLGRLDEALQQYLAVVVNWPEYVNTWQIKFAIGEIYERLKQAGTIPKSEADFAARLAYEQVLQDYPDCPVAKAARNRLAGLVGSIGKGEQI
jgi:tetratricopeptide (TPR) repeat protein